MKVCTLGPVYFHAMKMPLGKQILHVAKTQETNPPYRQGRGVIIRLWKDWRLAVGIWTKKIPDEDTALREALHARDDEMFDEDGELFPRFVRQAALEKVAKDTRDLDEEWEIVDALGLLTLLDECDCEGECDCDDEGGAAA